MDSEERNIETYRAMRTWAGSCNFCTLNDYDRVLVIKSNDNSRNLTVRLCPTCERELAWLLKDSLVEAGH